MAPETWDVCATGVLSGKRLGRPKRVLDTRRAAGLRAQGVGWKAISREMGIGVGTLYRLAGAGSKTREKGF